ncbi:hypothetical protein A9Q99_07215 [Gammaproteobacteria bacterium 45_16_T64]|nr:hypothetical protein A9Q99_07215 [Gammaproteobacteria bacterium 45_16_T64]
MEEFAYWLGQHQYWILLATALLAFFESLALVGILIPGVALLFAAAVAAGSAAINIWWLLGAGFVGAVLGDGLSFFLGRHFHNKITQLPPFNKHPEWITKGERFFEKYGVAGVVMGRFIGPIRPVMPLVAGMLEMPPHRFLTVNLLSAIAWSPFYLLPGYFVGAATENQHQLQVNHLILLLTALGLPWIITTGLLRVRSYLSSTELRQYVALTTFTLAGSVLGATYALTKAGFFTATNETLLNIFIDLRIPALDYFFVAVTSLGYWLPMVIWAAAIGLILLLQRHIVFLSIWIGATLVGQFSIFGLKDSIAWPRPNIVIQPPASLSFPSGHTAITIVFLGTLLLLMRSKLSPKQYRQWFLGSAIACSLVAISRLYLNVHWLSDIIAGACLGIMIVTLFYGLLLTQTVQKYTLRSPSFKTITIASATGIACAFIFSVAPFFNEKFSRYQLQEQYQHHERSQK